MDTGAKNPAACPESESETGRVSRDSLSMHANVPVWCDCCSCEVEPYWLEAFNRPDDEDSGSMA